MATEFRLPELGENIKAGDLVRILVSVGDTVDREQPVLELETDKATIEVPSPVRGVVQQIYVKDGDKLKVGQLIFTVNGDAESASVGASAATAAAAPSASPAAPAAPAPGVPQPQSSAGKDAESPQRTSAAGAVPAAPSVRRIARELGVDVSQVTGTGPSGRISEDDVKRYAHGGVGGNVLSAAAVAAAPLPDFTKWGEIERKSMSQIRLKTAERMSRAAATVPQVTQFDEADITNLEELRRNYAERVEAAGGKLTVTAIAVKVSASALRVFPNFATSFDGERSDIVYKKYCHVGVAVDTERGLLVPVIRDADQKGITQIAKELAALAEKARSRKLSPDEMEGGVFTITNLGGIGGTNFSPIVNFPEAAILGISRSKTEPTYVRGQIEPRLKLPLSLSYDHRLIDGADAARFLHWVVEALEQPFLLAL
jgi:pyruvate dehydrogenase E2 component (dihydrolipoamide acetyltransferase)